MQFGKTAACFSLVAALSAGSAVGADLNGGTGYGSYKDAPGNYWVVTVGGYGAVEPLWKGADTESFTFIPIFDIRKAGEKETLDLPSDSASVTLIDLGNFRAGLAAGVESGRYNSDETAIRPLRSINYTVQLGGFAEYYPVPFLRTRVEALQGVTGSEGFIANFSADFIYTPNDRWQFTLGPRVEVVNTQYQNTYYGINGFEANRSNGLYTQFHASGGLSTVGVLGSARYNVSDRFSIRGFAEYKRLEDDAADSPLVKINGNEDQFRAGLGAAYSFNLDSSYIPFGLGR